MRGQHEIEAADPKLCSMPSMSALAAPRSPGSAYPANRLHVLDITDFYSESSSGGVRTYLHAKASALARQGVRHTIVVPGARTEVDLVGASRVYKVPGPSLPIAPAYRTWVTGEALRRILERERPDVIEVGSPFIVPHLLERILGRGNVPTVGFYHADVVRTFAEPYVRNPVAAPVRVLARTAARRLVRRVYERFDVTVAASRSVAEELAELGVPRVRQVSLGVDLARFHPGTAARGAWHDRWGIEEREVPVGIYAGRFCSEKRLDVLLDGHARLPSRARPHFVLVGGGPLEQVLRRRAERQTRLRIVPYEPDRGRLASMYAAADFYLAPGPGETFGLSIGEALASGLPVVCVERGAAPDRIEGADVGELYRHGAPDSAAAAILRLTARLGPQIRSRARAHAERTLDWTRTFDTLREIYEELGHRPARW